MISYGFTFMPLLFDQGFNISSGNTPDFTHEHILNAIIHKYTQQHRFYHTLNHIEVLGKTYLEWCGTNKQKPSREMCLAILYHDIVYEPGNVIFSKSESAKYFERHAETMHLPLEIVEVVDELILSTSPTTNIPQTRLVDLDLLILAAQSSQYEHYAKGIRKEWQHMPDSIYAPERINFLNSMLNREHIYMDESLTKYDVRARANMTREIKIIKTWGTSLGEWSEVK